MESRKKRYVNVFMDEGMIAKVDRFWHVNRIISRTEAIRWLIDFALQQKPQVDPKTGKPIPPLRDLP